MELVKIILLTVVALFSVNSFAKEFTIEEAAEIRSLCQEGQYVEIINIIRPYKDDMDAMNQLVDLLEEIDKKTPIESMIEIFTKSGEPFIQNLIGFFYARGLGVTQNDSEAVHWYRLAAEQGYAMAQCNLGICYHGGRGVTQNDSEAVRWYRLAAEQGFAKARSNLGTCYDEGRGVDQDIAEAVHWYLLAAEQGYDFAQYKLGHCYEEGRCVRQDFNNAVHWYRLAAEQGEANGQIALGICYELGKGVHLNREEAIYWYTQAAKSKNAFAYDRLGMLYFSMRNYTKALESFRSSIENGLIVSIVSVANMYRSGFGVLQDYSEAARLYELFISKPVKTNTVKVYMQARKSLGKILLEGRGVSQDVRRGCELIGDLNIMRARL